MLKTIGKIIKHRRLTQNYPNKPLVDNNFSGKIVLHKEICKKCGLCVTQCPSNAICINEKDEVGINYDECIFCLHCADICPNNAIEVTKKIELAESDRNSLRHVPTNVIKSEIELPEYEVLIKELEGKIKDKFGRSLNIREVDSGSCNGCDYEINALNNPFNDVERLGLNFVASPRHADMLLVTGTCTRNMELALIKTYNATPDPKIVVAVGACACSGGIFKDSYSNKNGIDSVLPVNVYIPGCPPRPQSIIYGILKALDRI